MNEEYNRKAVFEELGQTIPEAEMQRAESYADLKLHHKEKNQSEKAETYHSGRYRVLLVADLVRHLAFSDFTIALCQLSDYELKGGIKENALQN